MEEIILTTFTDPMMGLSYESEPIMERLSAAYGEQIEWRYVMGLLVRDVSDFMTPEERKLAPAAGIARYCQRLARIYKNEESIGGLPINMENFCLFDENHRSSKPLNLAYEAAKLADHQKADAFLKALRHATVKAGLPTIHFDVILDVVRHSGIDETAFTKHYEDGSAEDALIADLAYAKLLRVHSLPTYLFQYQGKALFLQSFDYHEFVEAISRLTA